MQKSLGLIETQGLLGGVTAADAAVKSAPRGQDGEALTALLVELASGRRVAV